MKEGKKVGIKENFLKKKPKIKMKNENLCLVFGREVTLL